MATLTTRVQGHTIRLHQTHDNLWFGVYDDDMHITGHTVADVLGWFINYTNLVDWARVSDRVINGAMAAGAVKCHECHGITALAQVDDHIYRCYTCDWATINGVPASFINAMGKDERYTL